MFAEKAGVRYIFKAKKPLPKNYRQAMELMGTDCSNTVFRTETTDCSVCKRAGARCRKLWDRQQ